jgi:hypothetical protein
MTALHGTMTGAEVDALRLPLKKNLSALVADLPAHIATFRGHLARLTTAGQAPLPLDAYRLFLASLSSFPVFHQYALYFIVDGAKRGNCTANVRALRQLHWGPALQHPRPIHTSTLRRLLLVCRRVRGVSERG